MKNRTNRTSTKVNISFRRRLLAYYHRVALLLKIFIVLFAVVFFYTNVLDNYKRIAQNWFFGLSANHGFILENIIVEGQKNTPLKKNLSFYHCCGSEFKFGLRIRIHKVVSTDPI